MGGRRGPMVGGGAGGERAEWGASPSKARHKMPMRCQGFQRDWTLRWWRCCVAPTHRTRSFARAAAYPICSTTVVCFPRLSAPLAHSRFLCCKGASLPPRSPRPFSIAWRAREWEAVSSDLLRSGVTDRQGLEPWRAAVLRRSALH